jgi:hypothetical protein
MRYAVLAIMRMIVNSGSSYRIVLLNACSVAGLFLDTFAFNVLFDVILPSVIYLLSTVSCRL